MLKLREAASQDVLQIKKLTQQETALHLELADLRQTDKETKRLLFEKSRKALSAHPKISATCIYFLFYKICRFLNLLVNYLV